MHAISPSAHFRFRRALLAGGATLALLPLRAVARIEPAFDARAPREALDALLGGRRPERSDRIRIVTSELAENGAVVPITIESDLPAIGSVSFLAPENAQPLALNMRLGPRIALPMTFCVKLAKTQEVTVLVRAGEKDYLASRQINVVVGGCIGT